MENAEMIRNPILSSTYEAMKMSNGDLFFNSHYGKHARIHNVRPEVEAMIELCDGTRTVEEISDALAEQGYTFSVPNLEKIIAKLGKSGILMEDEKVDLPDWLTPEEYDRYHTLIGWFDHLGLDTTHSLEYFKKLRDARVGIIGMGGSGSFTAMMLAATGIGYVRIIDGDHVETSNLVRQVFYEEGQVGQLKVECMKERIQKFNHGVEVDAHSQYITNQEDAHRLLHDLDFVFLQADEPRFILNRWVNNVCVEHEIPYINSFALQIGPIYMPGESGCFTCLEQKIRETFGDSDYEDILNGLQKKRPRKYPSIVTAITLTSHYQFMDCIGLLTGAFEPLTINKIVRFKSGSVSYLEDSPRNEQCPTCGHQTSKRKIAIGSGDTR